MLTTTTEIRNFKLGAYEKQLLHDLEYLYWRSYENLEKIFHRDFRQSKRFKDMVLLLNQNMIEFMFLR